MYQMILMVLLGFFSSLAHAEIERLEDICSSDESKAYYYDACLERLEKGSWNTDGSYITNSLSEQAVFDLLTLVCTASSSRQCRFMMNAVSKGAGNLSQARSYLLRIEMGYIDSIDFQKERFLSRQRRLQQQRLERERIEKSIAFLQEIDASYEVIEDDMGNKDLVVTVKNDLGYDMQSVRVSKIIIDPEEVDRMERKRMEAAKPIPVGSRASVAFSPAGSAFSMRSTILRSIKEGEEGQVKFGHLNEMDKIHSGKLRLMVFVTRARASNGQTVEIGLDEIERLDWKQISTEQYNL